MCDEGDVDVRDPYTLHRQAMRLSPGQSDLGDIFAVNPIRRSFVVILICAALIGLPFLILQGEVQMAVELVTGWFGFTGLIMCTPILIWSLLEEGWHLLQRRLWPTIEQLDLTPHAYNLLRRHGYVTIASVEQTPDTSLLLLSNMDSRAVQEIRRSVNLWRYRRWQERGFQGAE
jgi:hypothetical protein